MIQIDSQLLIFTLLKYMLLMAAGCCLRCFVIKAWLFRLMNKAVFYLLFPIIIADNIWRSRLNTGLDMSLLLFALGWVTACAVVGSLIWRRRKIDTDKKPVMIQAMFRCNVTTYTMAFLLPMMSVEQRGSALLCTTLVTTFFNLPSVLVFSAFDQSERVILRRIGGILKNPCLIACAVGGVLLLSGCHAPAGGEPVMDAVSEICSAMAFVCVGAALYRDGAEKTADKGLVLTGALLRLVVIPVVGLVIAVLAGFRDAALLICCPLFSGPCTSNGHALAVELSGNAALSGRLVCVTQIAAPFAVLGWAALLAEFGFI